MAEHKLSLDVLIQPAKAQILNISKGDINSAVIKATITENGSTADLSGRKVRFECRKKDGTIVFGEDLTIGADSVITYTLPTQVATDKSLIKCAYFAFFDEDIWRETTEIFFINVQDSVVLDEYKPGDYISQIESLIAALKAFQNTASEAESIRETNETSRRYQESLRVTSEASRVEVERTRVTAETSRVAAERARENNEEARSTNESERVTAEKTRATAEASRVEEEARRVAEFADMEARAKGWLRYYCEAGEYDETTRKPTVSSPDTGTLYFVPTEDPSDNNQWYEWMWDSKASRWELLGTTNSIISPITTAEIDSITSDTSLTGSNVLNTTGLTYFWAKIKAAIKAVSDSLANYLPKSGGTISGNLTVEGTTDIQGYLPLPGGEMTGEISMPDNEQGIVFTDSEGFQFGAVRQSYTGTLWYGQPVLKSTDTGRGAPVAGAGTYITTGAGQQSIKVAVPNADNTAFTAYDAYHKGNMHKTVDGFTITAGTTTLPMTADVVDFNGMKIYRLRVALNGTALQTALSPSVASGSLFITNDYTITSPVGLGTWPMVLGHPRNLYQGYIGSGRFTGGTAVALKNISPVSNQTIYSLELLIIID